MDEYGHPTHDEYVAEQRRFAVSIARRVLEGEMTMLEGARVLSRLDGLDLDEDDSDWQNLKLVDVETEALPIGEVRALWHPDALREQEPDLERAERWARDFALDSFRRFVERFGVVQEIRRQE